MSSVGIAKLNINFVISFQCGKERNDPIVENFLILIFRLVWKFLKMKTGNRKIITGDNFKTEVLVQIFKPNFASPLRRLVLLKFLVCYLTAL